MRVPLRSRSGRRQARRGMQSLRRGRTRAGELVDEAAPLVGRGREAAESLAREAAEHAPRRARRRRRRRGVIALLLLAIAAGVALYLARQHRDEEPARLIFEPTGPDVAPPPEPPRPAVEEVQSEPAVAMGAERLMSEESDAEPDSAPAAAPVVRPLTARTEPGTPVVITPITDAAVEPPVLGGLAPVVEDEPAEDETGDEMSGPADLEEVPEAEEPAAAGVAPEPTVETPVAESSPAAPRSAPWFEPAVDEPAPPEPPEPAPEVERSMPLRAPARGANVLPSSSPAGAPFRPAGDGLPGGRSWPTLPS